MIKKYHSTRIAGHQSYFIIISAMIAYLLITTTLTSCSKEDTIEPVAPEINTSTNYAVFDYQDTLHIAYAMRTDLYDCNNLVFQFQEGGRLDLYSHHHLSLDDFSDTVKLVSYADFSEDSNGVVAVISTDLYPFGLFITRGKVSLRRNGDQYVIAIIGATESGLGFRSQFTGTVHDLTAISTQGSLTVDENTIEFHLGIMTQEGDLRTYHLLGSNPHAECSISSTVDLAGKSLPISSDPATIQSGNAVGLTVSIPYGSNATATSGTLQCSNYGNVYTFIISANTTLGNASGHFTGPIYPAAQ